VCNFECHESDVVCVLLRVRLFDRCAGNVIVMCARERVCVCVFEYVHFIINLFLMLRCERQVMEQNT